jgi:hypothetical protein
MMVSMDDDCMNLGVGGGIVGQGGRSCPKLAGPCLDTIFLPRISELRRKFDYDGPSILIVDRHLTHVTLHVIALCGARNVCLIRLVVHSSHLAQPLDLCVFGLLKIFHRKERQSKGMKGETREIYRALLAFYESTIIPMVR